MKESLQIGSFVYVIEYEQPWVNYFGIVIDTDGNNVTVANESGVHIVNKKQVSLALEE